MKLLTFEKNGAQRVGAKIDEGVVDLTAALASTHPDERHAGSLLEHHPLGHRHRYARRAIDRSA